MWKDPIVEENRQRREQLAQECNHDIAEICKRLRLEQAKKPQKTVTLPSRKAQPTRKVA